MVTERGDGVGEQPKFNANEDMATMMANMQTRLEEQARMIEHQVALMRNLQQQPTRLEVVQQPPLVKL